MSKLFYDHLIVIEEVVFVLHEHKVAKEEQREILRQIDEILHYEIVDVILTHLPQEHHASFLTLLSHAPHDKKTMHFIKEHALVDIEREIIKKANSVKSRVIASIQKGK
jgi:hypothetical protein